MHEDTRTTPKKIPAHMTIDSSSAEWWSSWSDWLKVAGFILGGIVTVVAVVGWAFSLKAGKLKDEASKLKEAAIDLFKQQSAESISVADAKAAEANRLAAAANERSAQLEKDAAVAKLELAKLQKKMAPRLINDEQRAAILAALNGSPRGPISVCCPMGLDTNSVRFAESIRAVLSEAGFETSSALIPYPLTPGMVIEVKDEVSPPWAANIQRAFGAAGITLNGMKNPASSGVEVSIIVGPTEELVSP